MKFRRLTAMHAGALGMTETQIVELGKILSNDPTLGDDLKADRRGPGGGPDATPYNMTKVVMAALANGPQTRAAQAVISLYNVVVEGNDTGGISTRQRREPRTCIITGG